MTQFVFLSIFTLSFGILPICFATSNMPAQGLNQRLLIVSFDGFRQLYFKDNIDRLPTFKEFSDGGVVSYKVRSVFPSDTFPNHWAIVTGMYSESHGIVSNHFYDPVINDTFELYYTRIEWWNQTDPIWTTAKRQGGHKKTSAMFWPGSSVEFPNDGTPDFYKEFDSKVSFEKEINDTLDYLIKENVDLAYLYFNEPDGDGHSKGVDPQDIGPTLEQMDGHLKYLLTSLEKAGLGPDVLNVILCADHGMIEVTDRLWINDYVDRSSIKDIPAHGASMAIIPQPGKTDELMSDLKQASQDTNLFDAYIREDVPTELHYSNNNRIADIMVICELGIYMAKSSSSQGTASHGFNPKEAPMRPIFMARGPAFKNGYEVQGVFETKDIYAIAAHVVGIQPITTNASFDAVREVFAADAEMTTPVRETTNARMTTEAAETATPSKVVTSAKATVEDVETTTMEVKTTTNTAATRVFEPKLTILAIFAVVICIFQFY